MAAEAMTLAGFAYYLEASVAINLAYGLIEQVHDAGWKSFKAMKDAYWDSEDQWIRKTLEPGDESLCQQLRGAARKNQGEWDEKERGYTSHSAWVVTVSTVVAKLVALVGLAALFMMGINPEYRLGPVGATIIFFFPVPAIAAYMWLLNYWSGKENDFAYSVQMYERERDAKRESIEEYNRIKDRSGVLQIGASGTAEASPPG